MSDQSRETYEIGPEELAWRWKEKPDLVVLDCREPEELQAAAIENVVHIPMREIPGSLRRLDPQRETVVLCHHGVRSMSVVLWLRQHAGFRDVRSLRGGIDAWAAAIDPNVGRY